MVPLKTFFGYPLKFGAYSLIVAELVILAISLLGFFKIADDSFFDKIESLAAILISVLGLYGIQKDNFVYVTSYTALQLIILFVIFFELVAAVVLLQISRLIFDIILTATMSFALLVTASYRLEMQQGGTGSSYDDYPNML